MGSGVFIILYPSGSVIKNVCQAGEVGLIPGSRRFPEKKMATHSSTLVLKIPWTEALGAGYYPGGGKESGMTE